jgi:hypothetical protein
MEANDFEEYILREFASGKYTQEYYDALAKKPADDADAQKEIRVATTVAWLARGIVDRMLGVYSDSARAVAEINRARRCDFCRALLFSERHPVKDGACYYCDETCQRQDTVPQ